MLQSQCEFERRRSKATVQGKWPGAARSGRVPSLTDTPYGWHCTYCTCVRADQRESQAPVHGMARPAACCRVQGPPVLGLAIALAPAEAGTATKRPCASRCGCVSCRVVAGREARGGALALHCIALRLREFACTGGCGVGLGLAGARAWASGSGHAWIPRKSRDAQGRMGVARARQSRRGQPRKLAALLVLLALQSYGLPATACS